MSTRLAFQGVACIRGGRTLFEGVDFALAQSDALVVTGPNGVGKSSLLRLAAGLLRAEQGTVICEGGCALADERTALDSERPLLDALQFWSRIDGGDAEGALAATGLSHLAQVPIRMLSTGQRRRAILARTLSQNSPIWLLDEPANGFDAEAVATLGEVVADHRAAGGIVVVASHLALAVPHAKTLALG